jgi:PEGA domain
VASLTSRRSTFVRALRVCLFAVVSVASLAARPTFAADIDADAQAHGKELLAEGLSLMDNGHAQEALAKFEAAYQIVPSPKVLFNMGLAHQALGNRVAALECFEGFLGELPDAPEDARTYAERQVQLLRADVSFVDISANAPGAEARIDERLVGLLPLKKAIVVQPGPHVVSIRQGGYEIFRQSIVAVAGKQMRVFAVAPPPASVQVQATSRPWQRSAFWIATGLSGVALAGGITGHITYESKSSDYKILLGKGDCNVGAPQRSNCENLRNAAMGARTWAWIGYSVAVASAGAALAFRLLEPKLVPPTQTAQVQMACAPSVALLGLSCVGRY